MLKSAAQILNGNTRNPSQMPKNTLCRSCKMANKVTHAHPICPEPGKHILDYGGEEMVILCQDCYERLQVQWKAFRRHVFAKMSASALQVINAALAVGLSENDPLEFAHAFAEFASSKRNVESFSRAWKPSIPSIDLNEAVKTLPPLPPPKKLR